MALYRLRKWITLSINGNKINWNVFKALYLEHSDVISGTYWAIDIPSLSGLPFFFLLCLPPSLALSTLSRSLAHREWVTWNELSHRRLCFQPERGSMWSSVMPDSQHNQAFGFHRHLREPLISKTDGWLLAVTLLMSVKSSWAQRPNQLARSDALLCLLHLATSAIILNLKRSVNNLTINCR